MKIASLASLFRRSDLIFCYRLLHNLRYCSSQANKSSISLSPLYDDILKKVNNYKRQLRTHNSKSSFHHRYLVHSINNLNHVMAEMECKRLKVEGSSNTDICFIPTNATLEILSNGTTHTGPCALIKTPFKSYLFNCPEGTSRFLPSLRLKGTNTYDFFITRGKWQNIGGISGVLLGKEVTKAQTRIHGPQNIKQYLECIRPFMDADFGSVKYPVSVEELTYEREFYEDPAIKVYYIPLFGASHFSTKNSASTDVAFLFEFKSLPKKIDILKIIELKVPKGPLIGQLKAGNTVELPDGRVIRPEQVHADGDTDVKECALLVAEVESLEKLQCLSVNSHMQRYTAGTNDSLNYVLHFTLPDILNTPEYSKWMNLFGPHCKHILLNGCGCALPQNEGPYVHQRMLHSLNADFFPLLYPFDFRGVVSQNVDDFDDSSKIISGLVLQRFALRGRLSENDLITFNVDVDELSERLKISESGTQQIEEFKALCHSVAQRNPDRYPELVVLGTSSAVPTKYRNVSSYLLRLSDTSNVMVDCGEGTYGQLRVLYGPAECERMLCALNALFVTHSHQDHMNGMFQVILKRVDAFRLTGIPYRPLVIVCNRNVRKPMSVFKRHFDDLEAHIVIVDISQLTKSPSSERSNSGSSGMNALYMDVVPHFPQHLFAVNAWNLRSVEAVQVHHTRMANGFVFEEAEYGRRVVFSGDTMPCKLLAERGAGADLLVHECTFEDGFEDDAFRKRHSTMRQAVNIGQQMCAKHVLLTHFSARYSKVPPLPDYLLDAGNVCVAMDNMVIRYDRLALLAKLLPIYRELYSTELFEMEARKAQRDLRKTVGYTQPQPSRLAVHDAKTTNINNVAIGNGPTAVNGRNKRKVSSDNDGIPIIADSEP